MNTEELAELIKDTTEEFLQYCKGRKCEPDECAIRKAQIKGSMDYCMCRQIHIGYRFDVADNTKEIYNNFQQYCDTKECYICPVKAFRRTYVKNIKVDCQSVYSILCIYDNLDLLGE